MQLLQNESSAVTMYGTGVACAGARLAVGTVCGGVARLTCVSAWSWNCCNAGVQCYRMLHLDLCTDWQQLRVHARSLVAFRWHLS